jgi:HPt (histidine-containing phosphotransfer) domain-containing protein
VLSEEEFFYTSLARDYLSHMKQQLERAVGRDGTDWQELQTLGNHLKGSSAMFGYPALSELGAVLERAAQEKNNLTAATTLKELLSHIRTL